MSILNTCRWLALNSQSRSAVQPTTAPSARPQEDNSTTAPSESTNAPSTHPQGDDSTTAPSAHSPEESTTAPSAQPQEDDPTTGLSAQLFQPTMYVEARREGELIHYSFVVRRG